MFLVSDGDTTKISKQDPVSLIKGDIIIIIRCDVVDHQSAPIIEEIKE